MSDEMANKSELEKIKEELEKHDQNSKVYKAFEKFIEEIQKRGVHLAVDPETGNPRTQICLSEEKVTVDNPSGKGGPDCTEVTVNGERFYLCD